MVYNTVSTALLLLAVRLTYVSCGMYVRSSLVPDIFENPDSGCGQVSVFSSYKVMFSWEELTKAVRGGRCMVRASVPALAPVGCLAGILGDDLDHVLYERSAGVIRHDGGRLAGLVSDHVLVEERDDGLLVGLVLGKDVLCAQQANLLGSVKVKLDGVLGLPAFLGDDAQGLKHNSAARSVVVGAGGLGVGVSGRRVEVGAEDDGVGLLAGEGDDGGVLRPAVLELLDLDSRVGRGGLLGCCEDVVGGGNGLLASRVAGVEAIKKS